MTLIVVLADPNATVVVADRMVSSRGRSVDRDTNELCVLTLEDARVVVGFTGLAGRGVTKQIADVPRGVTPPSPYQGVPQRGVFRTGFWLVDRMYTIAQRDPRIVPVLQRLTEAATTETPHARQHELSIYATGYQYVNDTTYGAVAARISKSTTRWNLGSQLRVAFSPAREPRVLAPLRQRGPPSVGLGLARRPR